MQNEVSDVLNQFRQGDVDAFEALFRQHQRAVYGWILRITRDAAAAEELTVETFWRIHVPAPALIRRKASRAGRGASLPERRSIGCGQARTKSELSTGRLRRSSGAGAG